MGFGVVWSVLAAPVCVLMVHGASTSNQSDGCSNNGAARLVSGSDSSNFSAALNNRELGDGRGFIEICHMENWMRPCGPSGEGDGMWTTATTTVACRELGYTAAASFGVHSGQGIGPSRILPYFPNCEGNEESLDDCVHGNDPTNDCFSPVVISCWNNSAVTSKPLSPSITQTAYTALDSSRLPATHSIPEPTSSRVPDPVAPSLETYMSSSLTQPAVTSLPQPAVTSLPPPSSKVLVSVAGAVGGVVLLQLAAIVAVLLLLCHRRQRVKPQDRPPSLPNGGRNATFEMEELPEFEALYDKTTAIPPPLEAREYHTLIHSPATQPSHPHTVPAAYETVAPSSSRGNPVRDAPREKPPVYWRLENPRERVDDHKYHTLEQVGPTRAVEPMYSEVAPRRAATLGSQKPRPSTPPPPSALTLSPPQNLSGSMTLL